MWRGTLISAAVIITPMYAEAQQVIKDHSSCNVQINGSNNKIVIVDCPSSFQNTETPLTFISADLVTSHAVTSNEWYHECYTAPDGYSFDANRAEIINREGFGWFRNERDRGDPGYNLAVYRYWNDIKNADQICVELGARPLEKGAGAMTRAKLRVPLIPN